MTLTRTLWAAAALATLLQAPASAGNAPGALPQSFSTAAAPKAFALPHPFMHRVPPQHWRRPLHSDVHQQYC